MKQTSRTALVAIAAIALFALCAIGVSAASSSDSSADEGPGVVADAQTMTSREANDAVVTELISEPVRAGFSSDDAEVLCDPNAEDAKPDEADYICDVQIWTGYETLGLGYVIRDFSLDSDCFTMDIETVSRGGEQVAGSLARSLGTGAEPDADEWVRTNVPGHDPDIEVCGVQRTLAA